MPAQNRSPKKMKAFLSAYAVTGSIYRAAKAAKMDRRRHYEWLESQEGYREAFEAAGQQAVDALEQEARRRAVDGLRRYKFEKGEPIVNPETGEPYYEHHYSDTLLIFLLKAADPAKYRENVNVTAAVEHSGKIAVVEDGDWYQNSDRITSEAVAASGTDTSEPSSVEGNGMRPKVGQNGNGHPGGG